MTMTGKWGRRFTVAEAAAYLGLPVKTVYRLVEEGRIACLRTDGRVLERQQGDGKTTRYTKSGRLVFFERDLDAWIEAHRVPARNEPANRASIGRPLADACVGVERPPARRRYS